MTKLYRFKTSRYEYFNFIVVPSGNEDVESIF